MVLIRNPEDAVLSFVVRDPIAMDQALKHYIAFYETVAGHRNAFILEIFEEVTSDYGSVIKRVNAKFGTAFLPFRNNEKSVGEVFARMQRNYKKRNVETFLEVKISRPSTAREEMKRRIEPELHRAGHEGLVSEAKAVYRCLTEAGE